jgi:hypothetical protein
VPNRYFGSRVTTRAELNEIAQYWGQLKLDVDFNRVWSRAVVGWGGGAHI